MQTTPRSTHPGPEESRSPAALAQCALKGFFQVTDRWGLDTREQMALLGQPPRSTFFAWKEGSRAILPADTLERINCVLGIWKALRNVIPDVPEALAWVRRPNDSPLFEGASPLAFMAGGKIPDLTDVRRFLDARIGVR